MLGFAFAILASRRRLQGLDLLLSIPNVKEPIRYSPLTTSIFEIIFQPGGRFWADLFDSIDEAARVQRRTGATKEIFQMKDLFEAAALEELKQRTAQLRPDSERQWGRMNAAQMLAHCSEWMEMAAGLKSPPRSLIGRVFGRFAKSTVLNEEPIRRNMPSDKSLIVSDAREFTVERPRLEAWMDRFAAAGPQGCTTHPHCFFGPMTPMEWATMAYKHLDHHLRQFGA